MSGEVTGYLANVTGKMTGKTLDLTGKTTGKPLDLVLACLRDEPGMTIPEIAGRINRSESTVERAVRELRAQGRIIRVGSRKAGHWQVVEQGQ